jgi:hypothetical protein
VSSPHEDPVESGALEGEPEGGTLDKPPTHEDPVESGGLEDEPDDGA